jgi:hypothetical protein
MASQVQVPVGRSRHTKLLSSNTGGKQVWRNLLRWVEWSTRSHCRRDNRGLIVRSDATSTLRHVRVLRWQIISKLQVQKLRLGGRRGGGHRVRAGTPGLCHVWHDWIEFQIVWAPLSRTSRRCTNPHGDTLCNNLDLNHLLRVSPVKTFFALCNV